ncbi:DNA-binding protein [Paucibacter sp. M5-1]|uniref:DNA-binding protein n=1 Tax=Paucibacter sp. M5-1 TaxID=3015998 RepID=UPI0022B8B834|nr:DNA-binding protein [Paucibacter sp. M5-1]MCZ7882691.1 DNA-binding protein [Paucibacter sp. M5-1]
MSLQNLLAIQRLQTHTPDPAGTLKLLQAAHRNLADAQLAQLSSDNRFDAAYKCIMQCAMLGLWASGYRTATSQPGHHQTAIQSLGLTMGIAQPNIIVLDALRRQRNLSDYEGDPVSTATVNACIEEATRLLAHTEQWLKAQHPHLLTPP